MTGADRPSCAVVVVNWNGGGVLPACLASLAPDIDAGVDVVVVDNASTDGSVDAGRLPDGVRVVHRPANDGFAAGANAGIRATTADLVVLLNNDAVAGHGWLEALTAPFTSPGSDDLAAVTGLVLLEGAVVPASTGADDAGALVDHAGRRWVRAGGGTGPDRVNSTGNEVTRSGNGRDRDWLAAHPVAARPDVFGFNGGCAALRRRALEDVGGFEESLFMYYEDTELSWRLRRRGWRVQHAPDAVVVHRHAASSGTTTPFFRFHNARNRLVVALRHAPWPVVARAYGRTLARLLTGPDRAVTGRAVVGALRRAPADLGERRRTDRRATVPRSVVAARWLVADR